MPETTTPKTPLSSFRGREDSSYPERSLARCVRRFQTYSQLPIRCHRPGPYYRPPRPIFRLTGLGGITRTPSIATAKSCPERDEAREIFRVIGTPRCRKSVSMIELSPTTMETQNDIRSDTSSCLERLEDVCERVKDIVGNDTGIQSGVRGWMEEFTDAEEGGSQFYQNPKRAGSLVCRVLILNAWRRRREEVAQLRENIQGLGQQIEHLHLQIIVLRRLLDTENNRVGKLSCEVHRAKTQLEDAIREKDTLKMEKGKMEEEIKRLSDLSAERLVAAENVRNELFSAQSQIQAMDGQIEKDREKLLKLREDKRILLEKVTASDAIAMERGARVERAESAIEDLQLRLAAQIALVESSQEQIQRYAKELRVKGDEKWKLEKRLRLSEETGRSLKERTILLETQLADREAALKRLESSYNLQLMELNELKERLLRQSQESGWSNRMLQLAGSVVRAPRVLLRTLSLLSTAGPPLMS